ncbi:hypothetical protein V8F20_010687 [Naviculisporaceae sp. PSN 640]
MASYNPNIANGTCYYAENTKTKGDFIPCGNDAIEVWSCCLTGSYCLGRGDANACWDPVCRSTNATVSGNNTVVRKRSDQSLMTVQTAKNTYVAGCTDPSFTSPNCARKPKRFHEQEWVAINQACKNLNDGSQEATQWTGCKVADDSVELFKLPLASCTNYCSPTDVVYVGSSSLAAFASLPTISGSSIFWQNNFVPATTPAPGYVPGTTTPIAGTSGPTPSGSSSGGIGSFSTGAKAGLGVGIGVGGILIIAGLFALFVFCRRKKRQQKTRPEYPNDNSFHPAAGAPLYAPVGQSSPPPPAFSSPATYHHHTSSHGSNNLELPTGYQDQIPNAYAPYTGYKSELPADEPHLHPGYPHSSNSSPPISNATTAMGGSSPGSITATRRSYSQRLSPGYNDTLPEGAMLEPPSAYGTDQTPGGGRRYYYGQPSPPSPGKDPNATEQISELDGEYRRDKK